MFTLSQLSTSILNNKSSVGTWDHTATQTTSITVSKAMANNIKLDQGPLQ